MFLGPSVARVGSLQGVPRVADIGHRGGLEISNDQGVVAWALTVSPSSDLRLSGAVRNVCERTVRLERLILTIDLEAVEPSEGLRFLKNGYQSWTETRSFATTERQRVPRFRFLSAQQDNLRNLPGPDGELCSDMYALLGQPGLGRFVLVGQAAGFRQFVYVRLVVDPGDGLPQQLQLHYDFGGQEVRPATEVVLDKVSIKAGSKAHELLDEYFDGLGVANAEPRALPTGWCSWYYYYNRVGESDVLENLAHLPGEDHEWQFLVLDDGYQTAVGDWLSVRPTFSSGLAGLAENVRAAGLTPGLWLAPFVARRNSRLFRDHPDWFLRDDRGRPLLAGWNPTWGWEGRFYGLDVTHPGFQRRLQDWIRTIVGDWGFGLLKLDFCYGACLAGKAYDSSLSSAERLSVGYGLIREAGGPGVFLLGCGSPLSAAIGRVDAMRIGPDVAPYWFASYRYHLTNDPHALCLKFALRSALVRSAMHRRLWINDPDCLMLRETRTQLTADERHCLANAIVITGGMHLISDRLAELPLAAWARMREISRLAARCDRGRAWALDLMEREFPEVVYNTIGYLAVFNFEDRPVERVVDLGWWLEERYWQGVAWCDIWDGMVVRGQGRRLELGRMPPHSSMLFEAVTNEGTGGGPSSGDSGL